MMLLPQWLQVVAAAAKAAAAAGISRWYKNGAVCSSDKVHKAAAVLSNTMTAAWLL